MNSSNAFNGINLDPDNERKFNRISKSVSSNVQKILQLVSSMKRMVNLLGTAQDNADHRQQLQNIQQYTQQLVKDTNNSLKTLNSISLPPDQREWRTQKERLTEEYTSALNEFQYTQREALKKQNMQVQKKRAAVHSSIAIPPPPSSDPFRDDLHANQLIELQDDRTKSSSFQLQMEDERNNVQQLLDQEEAIRNLERDINDVNEIYKSLGRLVHDQGEMIDSIEANIENAHISVRQATSELGKASNYMTKVRKKKLVLVGILLFVLLIIYLLYKYGP